MYLGSEARRRHTTSENFHYVLKGARSAPGPSWASLLDWRRAKMALTQARRNLRQITGLVFAGTLRAWAPNCASGQGWPARIRGDGRTSDRAQTDSTPLGWRLSRR